ncbi:hypothetical protein SAMN04487995_5982 [Dyadobacter koreensis]|uniref:Uncharacterized protein n=1 Tax=Dyadobacter koreensis TaxID=408657 RepID=A0A1H7B7P0_9BACT|nr:hypothetical protein [Dyadobacter koreensis]SEJ69415.1 hypothetical protein SAMN04487995_5982 [Dyadobacter koreensis]
MVLKKLKGRALRPDPNESLFKFKLSWADEHCPQQLKIQTWYSYDYSSERSAFPCGLSKELRERWKRLLGLCWKHDELYEFVKWLRPHQKGELLELYLPNWPQIPAMIPALEKSGAWPVLQSYGQSCGFNAIEFKSVSRTHPRQPSHSPGQTNFKQFYGFGYVQRNNFIAASLASGKLLKIDIYDNLIYHSENYLHSFLSPHLATDLSGMN